jgi:dTDP-4-amino-4,6-dideoxygalactose transaminase
MSALPGWNSRLGSLEAAILEVKLKSLPAMIAARRQIAARYLESLAGLPLLLPRAREGSEHAWHLFVIRCEDQEARHGLKQHLATRGIMAGLHYPLPVHLQPAYRGRCRTTGMASTEAIVPQILSIPIYPELRADQQSRVIAAIREYYEASQ